MVSLPDLSNVEREDAKAEKFSRMCVLRHLHLPLKTRTGVPHRAIRHTSSVGNYGGVQADKSGQMLAAEDLFAGNSPVSIRSTRVHSRSHRHHPHHPSNSRASKRDSMSSSGGASSVRHLISIVRSTSGNAGPVYSRRVLIKNFSALCLTHAMITAAFIPIFNLQSSISLWWGPIHHTEDHKFNTEYDVGSWLLSGMFAVGALSSLSSLLPLNKITSNRILVLGNIGACAFISLHLYPNAYTLIPAYILMGICLGPLVQARITCLMTMASKLNQVLTEKEEGEVENAQCLRRAEVGIHRLARILQIAQDAGLIVGNLTTFLIIWYKTDDITNGAAPKGMFPVEINGERHCGSADCPPSANSELLSLAINSTEHAVNITCRTGSMLISVYIGLCIMGVFVAAVFIDQIKVQAKDVPLHGVCCSFYKLVKITFKDPKLQLAAPLSMYIGLEQGFMYADFTKSYVACALGVASISLVFLSLGLLQSLAGFTLSLLLQNVRRHLLISVGFIFQSCLFLVLIVWKPSWEDPALFYVVPAAWGVCNAIWDTLNFTLIVSLYPEHWQAPFAHCYFFRYAGLSLSFALHNYCCNTVKLYLLAGAMVLSISAYSWLEFMEQSRRKLMKHLATL